MFKSLEIIETKFGNFVIDEYDMIGSCIKHYKIWEPHLYELYSQIITPDSYCIDAGANIGYHSIQFGNLGKKVYSFEPQSYIYNQLCANVLFNDLDNVIETYRLGLGDKKEKQQLWNIEHERTDETNTSHNWGGRGIIQDILGEKNRATKNEFRQEDIIEIIPLDSLEIPKCDFMKVDIQGYEYNMFVGANKLITTFKPIIFLENPDIKGELTSQMAKKYLIELGYDFYRLNINNNDDCIAIHPLSFDYSKNINVINKFKSKYNIIQE